MAHLARSAKSGSNWTLNDLESYHISLNQVNPCQFFGLQELPQPSVDEELLHALDADTAQSEPNQELLELLDLAMDPENRKPAVDDFAVALFRATGYFSPTRLARRRVDLPLLICGQARHAKSDVCIFDFSQNGIFRLVQKNMRLEHLEKTNSSAQLVAEAVAAFNVNNVKREAVGLPAVAHQVMPGIVMDGTSPTFFKIPVTQTLSNHIRNGTYPPEETAVTCCHPPVPRPGQRRSEGMRPLDSRREIFRCYEAFKAIV